MQLVSMETTSPIPPHRSPSPAVQPPAPAVPGDGGGFETDVFISYAHIDNAPLVPGEEGWISNLHHALAARLPQLIGGEVRIWRDPKLDGNDYIGDTLVDRLARTAVMIAVFSPRYICSASCRLEIETFNRCCTETESAQRHNKSRVFKVIKTPVAYEQQPPELQDLLGYEFFVLDPDAQRPRELRQDFGAHKDQRYWDRLEDLAYEVAELVSDLRSTATTPAVAIDKAPVYLAATSSDLADEYDVVRRELQQRGHPVFPDRPLPTIASEVEKVVSDYLARSRMAVHLIGNRYGLVPEGTEHSLIELQNDLAAASARTTGCQRLIWLPPELKPEDARQRAFIHRLETDNTAQANADLLRTELGELKRVVLNHVESKAAPEIGGAVPREVYLLYAAEDFDAAAPLEDALFEAGCELLTPLIDTEGHADLDEHQANLGDCEAVLVFQANSPEQWLRERLRELEQIPAEKPRAVYLAAPPTPRKQRLRTHKALVIKQFGAFEPRDLAPFFAELRRATEGFC